MKKLFGSFLIALAILASYGGGRWLAAYTDGKATKFYSGTGTGDLSVGDIKLNGLDILDSNGTTRITVGSANTITGSLTVTGEITNSTYLNNYLRTSAQIKASTPTVVGQQVFDTTLKQPIWSSGTSTSFDWVNATGTRPSGY